jgi:transcriptional regulator with XRE-family HTH domain
MSLDKIFVNGRKKSGLSIRAASKAIGLSPSYLFLIEKGSVKKLKMKFLSAAADLYNVDFDVLCKASERIPTDVFYKILRCPELINIIRNHKEG